MFYVLSHYYKLCYRQVQNIYEKHPKPGILSSYKANLLTGTLFNYLSFMLSTSSQLSVPDFQELYNIYSSVMYGAALKISTSQKDAEQILITSFQKLQQQNVNQKNYSSLCLTIVKLTVETAKELKQKGHIRLRELESTSILEKILFKNISLENICKQNDLSQPEALKKIREEINTIRNMENCTQRG